MVSLSSISRAKPAEAQKFDELYLDDQDLPLKYIYIEYWK